MADIHNALTQLSAVDWNNVPHDDLKPYLSEAFAAGELICNSVPPPSNGTPFEDAKPFYDEPNKATSHKDMHPSTTLPPPPSPEHGDLSKHWGKPQKFKNNPLNVHVYKMAGNDRHGAWFARKSVHEGLGFDKMKRAMLREFPLSLSVKGGPGAGAVRGIAADKRFERKDMDGVGKLEVYQLSAQFPGPTTPREFVAMLLSSDEALTDKSAVKVEGGKQHMPRHFMLVSRPVDYPDAVERPGYVRGKYESVEMIREIPLSTAPAKSTPNVLSEGTDSKDADTKTDSEGGDPELNPVEWIMVTRSDPGGGLPRFLVERGTPESIMADVHKFFDWACSQDEILHPDEDLRDQEGTIEQQVETETVETTVAHKHPSEGAAGEKDLSALETTSEPSSQIDSQGGVLSNITSAIGAGIQTYAPTSVANLVHSKSHAMEDDLTSISDSSISSSDSFMSADEMRSETTVIDGDAASIVSGDGELSKELSNSHDREVQKLIRKREKLNQQLAKKRITEELKLRQSRDKDSEDQSKHQERMDRELKKTEEKHRRDVEKLEAKKAKEVRKAEEKRAKKDDQTRIKMLIRERDDFRTQKELYRKENVLLQEQVTELQSQNNLMAQKLGKDVLESIRGGTGRQRTDSMKSSASASASSGSGKRT
ncbi:uncharacterized protein RCC_02413 [Ramularia collo-cygni]|uniref:DUF3074 domain-containing protein n=1 Tax=Ramularia collo-cygni TaxID=112498 RepID=A0A2D3V514_9PEZI|nr:uncharacterized protein RCC_02413 [Ramularia collo-cygni]CZT16579.1 uncharacterized protein RCC_02413 [Ramularia collo-cygni]